MKSGTRLLLILLALGQLTCNQAIMNAPSGSELTMFVNPEVISANGGVAVVSVLVVEPLGTPVADGTVVQFFTNLGDIPEQGKTNDGVVRVNFRANGRSGVATVVAVSGGAGVAPPSSSSTAPSSTTTAMPVFAAGIGNASREVTIGNLAVNSILVAADPPRITNSRSTQISATVFDSAGNPVPGAPVFFDVTAGAATNFMDSGGRVKFTDSNGQAFDVMRTRNLVSDTATVRARVPPGGAGGFTEGTVVVEIVI